MKVDIAFFIYASINFAPAVSVSSREAAALAQKSKSATASDSKAIPAWRLNMLLDEPSMQHQSAPTIAPPPSLAATGQTLDFQSSPAQDAQRCPLLKLPTDFYFFTDEQRRGTWSVDNTVALAKWHYGWTHPLALEGLQTVYIKSAVNGALSLMGKILTEDELKKLYGWEAATVNSTQYEGSSYVAITDCDGRLLFVVQQIPYVEGSLSPGHPLEIYGTDGRLLARTIMDQLIERIQFVDTNGYLLAVAESPGVNANITRANMTAAVDEGYPLPYGLQFQLGGYTNSSRLLEPDYRWIIATAVQVRAIYAANHAPPQFPIWATVLVWISVGLAIFVVGFLLHGIYRVVYPYSSSFKSKGQFPMYSVDERGL